VTLASAIVNTHALLELIYVSLIAGIGVCVVYAAAVVGITRSQERRRADRRGAAALYAALATIAIAACVWAAVTGIVIMTTK
jgi:Na+/H+-dicarboxylate symporter